MDKEVHYQIRFDFQIHKNLKVVINKSDFDDLLCFDSIYIERDKLQLNTINLNSSFFSIEKKVPNIIRYLLSFNKEKVCWELRSQDKNEPDPKFDCQWKKGKYLVNDNYENKLIFIILESPHIDEYKDGMSPFAPAAGDTGQKIHKYIIERLSSIFDSQLEKSVNYNICLVNPVPYQASLGNLYTGKLKKNLRDAFWMELFKFTQSEFLQIIEKNQPTLILNCCTKQLATEIRNFLTMKKVENLYSKRIEHPTRWFKTDIILDY